MREKCVDFVTVRLIYMAQFSIRWMSICTSARLWPFVIRLCQRRKGCLNQRSEPLSTPNIDTQTSHHRSNSRTHLIRNDTQSQDEVSGSALQVSTISSGNERTRERRTRNSQSSSSVIENQENNFTKCSLLQPWITTQSNEHN